MSSFACRSDLSAGSRSSSCTIRVTRPVAEDVVAGEALDKEQALDEEGARLAWEAEMIEQTLLADHDEEALELPQSSADPRPRSTTSQRQKDW